MVLGVEVLEVLIWENGFCLKQVNPGQSKREKEN